MAQRPHNKTSRKRFGARKAGRIPPRRTSDAAYRRYLLLDDMTTMRHCLTGQLRHVQVLDTHVVFGLEDGRQVRRSFRKALPWILNADRVGESN